ncbi:MAG TPA: hypothetical protein VGB22_07835 [candidate division Zixibacteria bacterium]
MITKRFLGQGIGVFVGTLLVCLATDAQAQRRGPGSYEAGSAPYQPPRRMVDAPTAGTLLKGTFDTELRAFPGGGMLGVLQVGLTNQWMIGLGYGGTQIISANDPNWNPRMNFLTKLQLLGETDMMPAIAVGFEEQGFGAWVDSLDRYENKSKGFFAVVSKGYISRGFISSIHGGVNYSREYDDKDKDVNFFFGADMRFENNFGFVAEYDMALNDDKEPLSLGEGYGYLNAGVRWTVLNRIFMEGHLKDLLSNRKDTKTIGRELRIIYVEAF